MKSHVYSLPGHYSPLRPARIATPVRHATRDELLGSWIVQTGGAVAKAPCSCGDQVQQPTMAGLKQRVANLEQAIAILVQGDDEPVPAKPVAPATDRARQPVRDARMVMRDKMLARDRQVRAETARQIRSISAAFRKHYSVGGR